MAAKRRSRTPAKNPSADPLEVSQASSGKRIAKSPDADDGIVDRQSVNKRAPLNWRAHRVPACLLAVFAFIAITSASYQAATYDEVTHLPAGYTYLKTGDYRLNPEHPPLLKMLAALPWLMLDIPGDPSPWIVNPMQGPPPPSLRPAILHWHTALRYGPMQYNFANAMLYAVTEDTLKRHGVDQATKIPSTVKLEPADYLNHVNRLMFWGRMPMVLLAIGLGMVIYAWTYELFGARGATLALALYCFEPNFLGHAPLVTTDVGLAFFFCGTLYALWRILREFSWDRLIVLAVFAGCAVAAKFSSLLLLPLALAFGVLRIANASPWLHRKGNVIAGNWMGRAKYVFLITSAVVLWSFVFLWGCYGFRYDMTPNRAYAAEAERMITGNTSADGRPPILMSMINSARTRQILSGQPTTPSEAPIGQSDMESLNFTERALILLHGSRILPESYVYGMGYMYAHSHGRGTFLRGESKLGGFRTYFFWTVLYKTPLIYLLLIGTAVTGLVWKRPLGLWDALSLLLPMILYGLTTFGSNLNIGHRHLLPIIPFLLVVTGFVPGLIETWFPKRAVNLNGALIGLVFVTSQCVISVKHLPDMVFPNYIGYFNEVAGGPHEGYHYLVDSNLDWGQGSMQLATWLDRHRISEPIGLFYFGMADPQYAGLAYDNLAGGYPFRDRAELDRSKRREYIAVHATQYQAPYSGAEQAQRLKEYLQDTELVDIVADSILIFRSNVPAAQ